MFKNQDGKDIDEQDRVLDLSTRFSTAIFS